MGFMFLLFLDFRCRFLALMGFQFRTFLPSLALSIIKQDIYPEVYETLSKRDIERSFGIYDVKRLEMYALNLVDYHLILDLVPAMAKLYFTNQLDESLSVSLVQAVCSFIYHKF